MRSQNIAVVAGIAAVAFILYKPIQNLLAGATKVTDAAGNLGADTINAIDYAGKAVADSLLYKSEQSFIGTPTQAGTKTATISQEQADAALAFTDQAKPIIQKTKTNQVNIAGLNLSNKTPSLSTVGNLPIGNVAYGNLVSTTTPTYVVNNTTKTVTPVKNMSSFFSKPIKVINGVRTRNY